MSRTTFTEKLALTTNGYLKALDDMEGIIEKTRKELKALPRTNFDRVTISPESLAKFINKAVELAIYHEQCFISDPCYGTDCDECITKWLEQEAEEETEE